MVLDRLNVHKAATRRWLAARPPDAPRVRAEWLPPYAPELNPAEQLWNHGSGRTWPTSPRPTAADLCGHVRRSLIRQRHSPNLLASFFDHACFLCDHVLR